MGRKIKGYKPHDERLYIPEAFGNRKDHEPIRVWIKTPTERDKREVEGDASAVRFAVDANGAPLKDKAGNLLIEIDSEESMRRHHRAVERFVTRVENYEGPAGQIVDGASLSEHGDTAVVSELYREIMSSLSLSAEDAKKFEGSPSSCLEATQVSPGIVPAVLPPAKASGVTAAESVPDSATS